MRWDAVQTIALERLRFMAVGHVPDVDLVGVHAEARIDHELRTLAIRLTRDVAAHRVQTRTETVPVYETRKERVVSAATLFPRHEPETWWDGLLVALAVRLKRLSLHLQADPIWEGSPTPAAFWDWGEALIRKSKSRLLWCIRSGERGIVGAQTVRIVTRESTRTIETRVEYHVCPHVPLPDRRGNGAVHAHVRFLAAEEGGETTRSRHDIAAAVQVVAEALRHAHADPGGMAFLRHSSPDARGFEAALARLEGIVWAWGLDVD